MSTQPVWSRLSRRLFLGQTLALGAVVIAACGAPPPSPTAAPKAPPTVAPVPTAAPAIAAKPAEPTKPAVVATTAPAPAATTAPASKPAATTAPASKPAGAGLLRPPEPNPKHGGKAVLAAGVTTNHFDIHQGGGPAWILVHTYNNIVRLNPADGLRSIVPDLAESWEVSADNRIYTFKLRSGVKWHDGSDFTADDVVATFNRIIKPPEGVVSVFKAQFGALTSVEAPDKLTVKMTLSEPRAYFLELLTTESAILYSKKALDENKGDLRKVIAPGTGAYIFKDHKVGEKWTLDKNPNYWDKELPYIDSLEFINAPAWSDRGTAILSGQADLSWNVSKETFEEGQKRKDTIGTFMIAGAGAYMVYFNTAKKPFSDVNVRRACHLALSRQDLFEAFKTQEPLNYTRYMSHGFEFAMTPDDVLKQPGYRADKKEDIATAKKLLTESGFPDGIKGLQLITASVGPHAQTLAPATQAILKTNIAVESTINAVERAVLNDEMKKGQWDMSVNTIGFPLYDPTLGWINYFSTNGPNNLGKYSNPKFDDMLKTLDKETDLAKRKTLFRQMEDFLDQESPWMTIGFTSHLHMWKTYLKGMQFDKRVRLSWGKTDIMWIDK
ncbi:MAG: ABC transporter substrate-binding protein [Chloroflexi bacterium]|nr:ABC transporter substrate-binding protein [Chloroflexota bacterium]